MTEGIFTVFSLRNRAWMDTHMQTHSNHQIPSDLKQNLSEGLEEPSVCYEEKHQNNSHTSHDVDASPCLKL